MTEDDVEGQEDQTVDFDDGEKITPFNMKEEMEEGHFDKQGNYFFKKDADIKVRLWKEVPILKTCVTRFIAPFARNSDSLFIFYKHAVYKH